jgi:CheY-like chemotaxis protein
VTADGAAGRSTAPDAAARSDAWSDADISATPSSDQPARGAPSDASVRRLAHDVNNSLAAIAAFAHLLNTDPALPPALRRQAELLASETERLRTLTAELLGGAPGSRSPGEAPVAATAPPSMRGSPPTERLDVSGAERPLRVLVLDDEAAIREVLGKIIARSGYEPIAADSGLLALRIVESDPPDAILCDHRMGGMSGVEFHAAVARLVPRLARRFAFMSGDASDADLRETAAREGVEILWKPFDVGTVSETVTRLLAAPD